MSEIINIQLGKCGNYIGSSFLQAISEEHGIEPSGTYCGDLDFQLQHINRFYNENTKGKYTPRFIPVDLDSITIDSIRTDNYGKLFSILIIVLLIDLEQVIIGLKDDIL